MSSESELMIRKLKGRHQGKRGLWIGSGPSSGRLLQERFNWFNQYSFVIIANQAYEPFVEYPLRTKAKWYWVCIESTGYRFKWFWKVPNSFTRLVHHLNYEHGNKGLWRAAGYLGKQGDLRVTLVNRNRHGEAFNPREYDRGLHAGPVDKNQLSRGTITLQAMHLAALMGAKHLDMYGVEFCAVNNQWHFYEPLQASLERYPNRESIISVKLGKREWLTHIHFLNSPVYIDSIYPKFVKAGMTCARHCDSLLKVIPHSLVKTIPREV